MQKKNKGRLTRVICVVLILIVVCIIVFFHSIKEKILYQGSVFCPNRHYVPDKIPDEFHIGKNDIYGYFMRGNSNILIPSLKYVLYSHGNAGNIYTRLRGHDPVKEYLLQDRGYTLVYYDYRGYGKSGRATNFKTITEQSICEDIYSVWEFLVQSRGIPPQNIYLLGESIGCVPTTSLLQKLATLQKIPRGVILLSGFYSLQTVLRDHKYGLHHLIKKTEFNNFRNINSALSSNPSLPIHILIIHSQYDELIYYNSNVVPLIKDLGPKVNTSTTTLNVLKISGSHNIIQFQNPKENVKYLNSWFSKLE